MSPRQAIDIARAALARGPLTKVHVEGAILPAHYRFGRRIFNAETVKRLIEAGEAIRDGNEVRAV